MKKIIFLILTTLTAGSLSAQTGMIGFAGNQMTSSYIGTGNLFGYKAVNSSNTGWGGLMTASATDTTLFVTDGNGFGVISNSNNNLRINATNVGIAAYGTTASDASAIVNVASTTKGFLAPRMTAAQKSAIASPATGLLIYQTDGTAGFYYYSGAAWLPVGGTASVTGTATQIPYFGTAGQLISDALFYRDIATGNTTIAAVGSSQGVILGLDQGNGNLAALSALTGLSNSIGADTIATYFIYNPDGETPLLNYFPTDTASIGQYMIATANDGSGTATLSWSDAPTSATYAPDTTETNQAPTAFGSAQASYLRIGNIVSIEGQFYIESSATGSFEINIELPFATTATSASDLIGTALIQDGTSSALIPGLCDMDHADNTMLLGFTAATIGGQYVRYSAQYEIK